MWRRARLLFPFFRWPLNSNALLGQTCQSLFLCFVSGLGMGEEEYSPEPTRRAWIAPHQGVLLGLLPLPGADGRSKSQEIIRLCWSLQTIWCRGLVVSVTTLLSVTVSGFGGSKDPAGGRRGDSVWTEPAKSMYLKLFSCGFSWP